MRTILLKAAALLAILATGGWTTAESRSATKACEACVRAHMQVLASPAMNGRKCATSDELKAARYIEGELKGLGVKGAMDGGTYLQSVPLVTPRLVAAPVVEIAAPSGKLIWTMGKEALITRSPHSLAGPLVHVTDPDRLPADVKGAVVFLDLTKPSLGAASSLSKAGAAAVFTIAPPALVAQFPAARTLGREAASLTRQRRALAALLWL